MDRKTADTLNEMTSAFYLRNADSFSQTRQNPWQGWEKLAEILTGTDIISSGKPIRVLDVACGNLRFKSFLTETFPHARFEFTALDNCAPLAIDNALSNETHFIECDLVSAILDSTLHNLIEGTYDLIVSFGFMHHVPGLQNRLSFARLLSSKLSNKGLLALSLWRFMEDERIARKAHETTSSVRQHYPELALEDDDFFLGWKDQQDTLRYCHHFADAEISKFASALHDQSKTTIRFEADGRSEKLNAYLIASSR